MKTLLGTLLLDFCQIFINQKWLNAETNNLLYKLSINEYLHITTDI